MKAFFLFISVLLVLPLNAQQFRESAEELGITHATFAPNMMAGGVAVLDYNNDNFEDLYFIGGQYPDHLYRNNGDETFTDVSADMGINLLAGSYTMGVVAGDLDNDGFTDLFITTYKGERNICLKNNQGLHFENVTIDAGFFGTKWSTTATMSDVDLDGDLDIYVSNFIDFSETPFFNHIEAVEPNFFFENLGNWEFDGLTNRFQNAINGCTLVSCFTDFDNDRDPDLMVINDFGKRHTPNQLFVNNNDGFEFIEQGKALNMNARMDGMGIAIGDIDQNGFLDYYVTNIKNNLFYLGNENAPFTNVSDKYQINDGLGYSWGTFMADMNNDSYTDLFVAKGSISESTNVQLNKLYQFEKNTNDFIDVTEQTGLIEGNKARGTVYADLNNDGWLDIVVNNVKILPANKGQALVYFNQKNKDTDFLKLKLEGINANKSAYGTRVELYSESRKMSREINGGSSYCSHNSAIVHFGLAALTIDSLVVYWAGSQKQIITEIAKNKYYSLKEGNLPIPIKSGFLTSTEKPLLAPSINYSIYPNPVKGQLTIAFKNSPPKDLMLELINPVGQTLRFIKEDQSNRNKLELNIADLEAGLYYLRVSNQTFQSVQKVILLP